jgi:hypothetical protein
MPIRIPRRRQGWRRGLVNGGWAYGAVPFIFAIGAASRGRSALHERVVGRTVQVRTRGQPVESSVLTVRIGDLPPREPGLAELAGIGAQQLRGCGEMPAEQCLDAGQGPAGRRDGELLAGDLEQQGTLQIHRRKLGQRRPGVKGWPVVDEPRQHGVGVTKVGARLPQPRGAARPESSVTGSRSSPFPDVTQRRLRPRLPRRPSSSPARPWPPS